MPTTAAQGRRSSAAATNGSTNHNADIRTAPMSNARSARWDEDVAAELAAAGGGAAIGGEVVVAVGWDTLDSSWVRIVVAIAELGDSGKRWNRCRIETCGFSVRSLRWWI